jgi:hypothetical protein
MFQSRDKHWRVAPVSLNGVALLRLTHDTLEGTPVHQDGGKRAGSIRVAGGWFLAGDFRTPAELEKFVPLAELGDWK